MTRDILFLLKHGFPDGDGAPYYCPECAEVNGVLHYYPHLRHLVDVRYVDYPRPRAEVVELVGADNQGCPVLVIGAPARAALPGVTVGSHAGLSFVSGARDIGNYLSLAYGVGRPH